MDFVLVGIVCGLGYATLTIYMTKTQQRSTERASMAKNTANYGNDSIRQLKDEERVRLRPAVIFGSDGLDGCAHAAFEILSNAVDEARQGYGKLITLTAFRDGSIQVEDNGRGCPLDWNPSEKRFNWELVFCELYAGGKYNNNQGGDYDFSLGTNGLGSCATQYASEYMDVTVWRDGNKYSLHFKKGKVVGAKRRHSRLNPATKTAPVPPSSGAPILRSLPRLVFPTSGIARPCAVRPWSTPT